MLSKQPSQVMHWLTRIIGIWCQEKTDIKGFQYFRLGKINQDGWQNQQQSICVNESSLEMESLEKNHVFRLVPNSLQQPQRSKRDLG